MSFVNRNHLRRRDALGRLSADVDAQPTADVNVDVDDRRTPDSFFAALDDAHRFTVDAAASAENAKCKRYFDRSSCGLSTAWRGEVVWCNPPYSDLYRWTLKALSEVAWGGCHKVVMLLPANRSEQRWWQWLIEPIRDRGLGVTTTNVHGRLKFAGAQPSTKSKSPPFGCVLVTIVPPTRNRVAA